MQPSDATDRWHVTEITVELGGASPHLIRLTATHPSVAGTRHGYAVMAPGGTVLIDPNEPAPPLVEQWEAAVTGGGGPPLATLLTSSWHERDAYALRDRYGIPVWGPRAGAADLEGVPDHLFGRATALPGDLDQIPVATAAGGDTILGWRAPSGERVLFTGDAIMGGGSTRPGHWRERPGLYAWLPAAMQPTPALLKQTYTPLLSASFDLLCSAHGLPVPHRGDPRALLARLLETGTPTPSGSGLALPL